MEQMGRKLTSILFNFKKEQQNKKREGFIIERSSMALRREGFLFLLGCWRGKRWPLFQSWLFFFFSFSQRYVGIAVQWKKMDCSFCFAYPVRSAKSEDDKLNSPFFPFRLCTCVWNYTHSCDLKYFLYINILK